LGQSGSGQQPPLAHSKPFPHSSLDTQIRRAMTPVEQRGAGQHKPFAQIDAL
uniref:Transcriptional regulator n=1 Tax=Brugia timori TaxID=42155 RepID=A0A0R3QFZ3_9BILA